MITENKYIMYLRNNQRKADREEWEGEIITRKFFWDF